MAGRSSRRRGSARFVLAAAVAPVMALLGGPARGETKTFSANESDWLTATNWSPTGVPLAGDTVVIGAGTSSMSVSSDLTIQRILFSDASSRILGNMTDGDGDANLTLTGVGGGRLIDVSSTGSFTITGPNIDPLGDGTGRLNLKFLSAGDLNVTNAAAKLILNTDVDEVGGAVSLGKMGAGELDVRRALNVSGTMTVTGGTMRLRGASGRMLFAEEIHLTPIEAPARLLLDNSTVVRNDRIGDQAKLIMAGGSIFEVTTGAGLSSSERAGFVSLTRVGGDFTSLTRVGGDLASLTHVGGDFVMRLSGGGLTSLTWIGLDRAASVRGVLNMETPVGSNFVFENSPGLPNDIIGDWAVINGDNWATLDATGTVVPFTNYETGSSLVWSPRSNVFLYGDQRTVSSDKSINTLKMGGGAWITLEGNNVLGVGGIIASGGTNTIGGSGRIQARDRYGNAAINAVVSGPSTEFHVSRPIADPHSELDLVKSGSGRMTLDAENTIGGSVYVNGGTLRLGASGKLELATVDLSRDGILDVVVAGKTIGGLAGGGGSVLIGSTTLAIGSNDRPTIFGGVISGTGGINKVGRGTLTMTGPNTYGGLTMVSSGTLNLQRLGGDILIHGDSTFGAIDDIDIASGHSITLAGGTATISVADGKILRAGGNVGINELIPDTKLKKSGYGMVDLYIDGDISGATLVKEGGIRLAGTGGSLAHTSAVVVSGPGYLWQDNGDAGFLSDRVNNSAPIVLDGGTLKFTRSSSAGGTEVHGPLMLSRGGVIQVVPAGSIGVGPPVARFASLSHDDPAATLYVEAQAGDEEPVSFASPPTLDHGIIGPWAAIYGNWATINPAGNLTAFAGYNDNPATWGPGENALVSGWLSLSSSVETNTLKLSGGSSLSIAGGSLLTTGGILTSGSGAVTIGGSGLVTSPAGSAHVFAWNTTADLPGASSATTISVRITDNGSPVGLVTDGPGTIVLHNGGNTYSGATKVGRNVLKTFFETGDIPTQSQLVIGGGTLDVSNAGHEIASLSGFGSVVLGSQTLEVGGNGMSSRFSGTFSGTGDIVKVGAGTLTLDGAINTTGELHVSSGKMRTRINDLEAKLQAFGLLASVRLGSGTTSGGVEIPGAGDALITAPVTVESGGGTISVGGNLAIKGVLSGAGGLLIESLLNSRAPMVESSAPMTHSGATTLDGVTLSLTGDGQLTSTSKVTLRGGGQLWMDPTKGSQNRLSSSTDIEMHGGRVLAIQQGTAPMSPTMGDLSLKEYDNVIGYQVGDTVVFSKIIYQSLEVMPGATGNFHLPGNSHVGLNSAPAVTNGIISPGVTVNGTDWATYLPGSGEIVAYSSYQSNQNSSAWALDDNVDLTGNVAISSSVDVHTLRLAPAASPRTAGLVNQAFLQVNGILANGEDDRIAGNGSVSSQDAYRNFVAVPDRARARLTISVPIVDNSHGPVNVVKGGEGTLVLTGANTYTGSTIVGNGVLKLAPPQNVKVNAVEVAAGARLEIAGGADVSAGTLAGPIGAKVGIGIGVPVATLSVGRGGGSSVFSGEIYGPGAFTKTGAGTLTLNGFSRYSGLTTVEGGTLLLAGDGSLGGTSGVVLRSGGVVRIDPAGSMIDHSTVSRVASGAPIHFDGGTLELVHVPTTDFDPVCELLGPMSVRKGGNSTKSPDELVFNVINPRAARSTMHFETTGHGVIGFEQPIALTNGIIGPWATTTNAAGQTDWATVRDWAIFNGTKWEKVDNTDNYETGGPATWTAAKNISRAGSTTVLDKRDAFTLKLEDSAHVAIGSSGEISTAGILAAGTGSVIDGPGSITALAGSDELIVHVPAAGEEFEIASRVTNNTGPVSLVKAGPGTLILNAASTHSGETVINEGTVQLGQFGSLIDSTLNMIDDRAFLGLREYDNTIGGLTGGGGTVLLEDSATLTIAQAGDTSFAGTVAGSGAVVKRSGGNIAIGTDWTYSGSATIAGGKITLDGGGLPNVSSIYVAGGAFVLDGTRSNDDGLIQNSALIEMSGGTLSFVNMPTGSIQTVGLMKAKEKANRTKCQSNLRLISSGFQLDPGATMEFEIGPNAGVTFTSAPAMVNGIISPGALYNTDLDGIDDWDIADWAIYDGELKPLANYVGQPSPALWAATQNVLTSGPVTFTGDTSVNTLKLGTANGGVEMAGHGISARGLMFAADGTGISGPGTISSPTGDCFVAVPDRARSRLVLVSGSFGSASRVILFGGGKLQLDASNTMTGDFLINDGTLQLGEFGELQNSTIRTSATGPGVFNPAAWTKIVGGIAGDGPVLLGSSTLTVGYNDQSTLFSGPISGAGGSLVKTGAGTLTLTGETLYTGETVVAGGVLDLDGSSSLRGTTRLDFGQAKIRRPRDLESGRLSNSSPVEMAGGTLEMSPSFSAWTEQAGVLRMLRNNNVITSKRMEELNAGTIRFTGTDFEGRALGTTANFNVDVDGGPGEVVFESAPALTHGIIGPWATVNGTDWATTQVCPGGVRVWPHSGYWNDSNSATWDGSKNIGLYVSEVVGSSATANTIRLGSNAGAPLPSVQIQAPSVVLRTDGMIFTGNGHTISGPGTLTTKSSTGPSCLFLHGVSGSSVTISSSITDNGNGPVSLRTKEGLYVLDGSMRYTGDTLVGPGTLRFTATGRLQDGIVDVDREGILDLAGFSKTIGGLSGGGAVTLGTGTLTVGTNNQSTTFGGGVSGAGGLTKVGDGTLALTGESTLAGPLIVKGGEVVLSNKFRLPLLNYAAIEFASIKIEVGAAGYRQNLSPTAPLNLSGGEIEVRFGTGLGKTDLADLGVVNVNSGGNHINVDGGAVSIASVSRGGGTNINWDFQGGGSLLVASPPTMTNGIVGGWATRSVDDGVVKTWTWATMQPDGTVGGLTSFEDSPPAWGAFVNGRYVLRAGVPLRFDANSLVIEGDGSGDPSTLTLDTGTSVLTTGGLMATGVSGHQIVGPGKLTSSTNELIVHVPNATHGLIVGSEVCDEGGNALSMIKAGAGSLVLSGTNTYSGPTIVNEGTLEITSSASLGNNGPNNGIFLRGGALSAGNVTIDASDRRVTVNGSATLSTAGALSVKEVYGDGTFIVDGGGSVTAGNVRTASIKVRGDLPTVTELRVGLSADGNENTSVADTIEIGANARLNLGQGKLILNKAPRGDFDASEGTYDGVHGLVQKGRGDGSWNGLGGIVTSMTDATGGVLTTIACATGAEIRGLSAGQTDTWGGQTITGDSVLLMYSWGGDADMNGELNGDDYFYLDSNILQSGSVFGFHVGDFDYNGELNGDDYFILDSNILQAQASGIVWASGAGVSGLASVPEPTLVGLLVIPGLALARRRRRN